MDAAWSAKGSETEQEEVPAHYIVRNQANRIWGNLVSFPWRDLQPQEFG
jgi:hypothetical protein